MECLNPIAVFVSDINVLNHADIHHHSCSFTNLTPLHRQMAVPAPDEVGFSVTDYVVFISSLVVALFIGEYPWENRWWVWGVRLGSASR